MNLISRERSGIFLSQQRIAFMLAVPFLVAGCIDARIDEHGVVQGNHPKAKELLEFMVAIDGDSLPMRKEPATQRWYVGVIEPGELSSYFSGVLPETKDVDSPSHYAISASLDTIGFAQNAVVLRHDLPLDGPLKTSFYHLQWRDDRQTWYIRSATGDEWEMSEHGQALDWKTPEHEPAHVASPKTAGPKPTAPKKQEQWIWLDGGWNEVNSEPEASDENE